MKMSWKIEYPFCNHWPMYALDTFLTVIILYKNEFLWHFTQYHQIAINKSVKNGDFSLESHSLINSFIRQMKWIWFLQQTRISIWKIQWGRKNNVSGKCLTFMWRRWWRRWKQRCKLTNYMHVLSWWRWKKHVSFMECP